MVKTCKCNPIRTENEICETCWKSYIECVCENIEVETFEDKEEEN